MKPIKILLFLALLCSTALGQVTPMVYYTFDNANPLTPSIGTTSLSGGGTYSVVNGLVGRTLQQTKTGGALMSGQSISVTTTIVVEMLFKADYNFSNNRDAILFTVGSTTAKFIYPELRFGTSCNTGSGTVDDNFAIRMDGVGPKSWKYYQTGWHHLVFSYEASTGRKTIYVDGVVPAGFSKTVTPGTVNSGSGALQLSNNTSYVRGSQFLDEIAVYNQSVSAAQVCGNYTASIRNAGHYTFAAQAGCTGVAVTAPLDSTEFPYGYVLGSTNSSTVTRTALTQLKNYVLPRWPDVKDAPWNVNWLQLNYFAGQYQPGVNNTQVVDTGLALNIELSSNWNYGFLVNYNAIRYNEYGDTTRFPGKMVAYSNRNKGLKTHIISYWNQLNPQSAGVPGGNTRAYVFNQNLPNNHYLRNGAGQFLTASGTVTTGTKVLSPAMPLDSIKKDAEAYNNMFTTLAAYMTDTLDLVSENDEVFPILQSSAMGQDPAVLSAMSLAGFSRAREFLGYAHYNWVKLVRDSIRKITPFANTYFTVYQIDGEDSTGGVPYARVYFDQRRRINEDPLFGNTSTVDIYPRYPWNWRFNSGAYRGVQPLVNARNTEVALGVKYITPFISPGYNENEEINIRPAQWLGYLKCMSMMGARRYNITYFNTNADYNPPNPPPFTPKGYAWQAAIPIYAQAATDWVMNNGDGDTLLAGDMPQSYVTNYGSFFGYYSGNAEIWTVVRKKNTGADTIQYSIATTLQRMSNMIQPSVDTAVFTLEGRTVSLPTRRQGSVYTLDLNKDSAVLVQWDGWHPATHPDRWSSDIYMEAEADSEYVSGRQDIRTQPSYASAGSSFDFSNFTTYVSYQDSGTYSRDTLTYNFTLRTAQTLNLWVRMRSANVNKNSGFTARMDNGVSFTQNLVLDTAWKWYRIDIALDTMRWTGVTAGNHTFKMLATGTQSEIDQFVLTPNSLSLPEGVPGTANPCLGAPTVTISPSGPINQCGGTATLTAQASTNYLWSNGATTQSITVAATGVYVVTATSGAGCTTTSLPVSVTIKQAATATTSPSGTINNCTGSQVITASLNSSYLWSTGATTQSITRTSSGVFTVTVTNSAGCTAVSAAVTLNVSSATKPTISPSGIVGVCAGTPTTLTSSSATAYLWSNGSTTQSITPSIGGTYSVRTTDLAGCTSVSDPTTLVIQSLPNVSITSSAQTYCSGTTALLTASGAVSYLWSTGATTDTISVSASDIYSVTGYSSLGCADTASVNALFVNCACEPPASIAATKINAYNAKLAWSLVTGSYGYQVIVTDMSTTNGSQQTWRGTTTTIWVTKLRPQRRYKVEIRTLCGNAILSSPAIMYFTTQKAL